MPSKTTTFYKVAGHTIILAKAGRKGEGFPHHHLILHGLQWFSKPPIFPRFATSTQAWSSLGLALLKFNWGVDDGRANIKCRMSRNLNRFEGGAACSLWSFFEDWPTQVGQLCPQLSQELFGIFSGLRMWMYLTDFQNSCTMLALKVGFVTFCDEPETFSGTAIWTAFQRFAKILNFI